MNAQKISGLAFILVAFTLGANAALAIPNQALNPHSDAVADLSYRQDNTKPPEQTNHFHLPLRDGETISVSDADNYGIRSNKGWVAFDVWDNNQLRFEDTPKEGDARNELINNFGHGFIDSAQAPLYSFQANVPAAARPVLAECFTSWTKAAQAQTDGKTSPSGKPLALGISFKEAAQNQPAQFEYIFNDNLQGSRKIYGEWVTSQDSVFGVVQTKNAMYYETNPTNFVTAPQGYSIRVKGTNSLGHSVSQRVGWSFDKTPDAIEVDLEYIKDDGFEVKDFLEGLSLLTNTGLSIECKDKIKFYQMDFYTIALHETGHILGLFHAPDDPAGNIMRANIEYQAAWGQTLQKIDDNSAYGAALLYTIPVPEPTVLTLALIGLIGAECRRRTICRAL